MEFLIAVLFALGIITPQSLETTPIPVLYDMVAQNQMLIDQSMANPEVVNLATQSVPFIIDRLED